MALEKNIISNNGVTTKYHRIVSINKIINICDIIEVASYTSKSKRQEEIDAIKNSTNMDVYIETEYLNVEYDEDRTIKSTYEYLKTLDKYKDSINI